MDLPPPLHDLADLALEGASLRAVTAAAGALSGGYRAEALRADWHLNDDLAARAYLLTRFPATYGAALGAMAQVAAARPEFAPETLLDVGSGPGTAFWAAQTTWGSLTAADLLEGSPAIRAWGERLAARSTLKARWHAADLRRGLPDGPPADLVTLAYVLNELPTDARRPLVSALWARAADTLLIVEPGTPAGWARILDVRDELISQGAHLIAPCPHARACPLHAPDWCHFAARVPRSRLHRLGKEAELGYEDEKFIYLAASRTPREDSTAARVLAPPHGRSGLVTLKLCEAGGEAHTRTLSKRQGETFRVARRLEWGDALPTTGAGTGQKDPL